jgi:hypothetical protein
MNEFEKSLIRSRKSISQIADEFGVDIEEVEIYDIDQCCSCSIWLKYSQLKEDLDGNLICRECYTTYGP